MAAQRESALVRALVGLALNYAPEEIVKRVEVRGARRPELLGPEHVSILIEPLLDRMTRMSWSAILLEDIAPVPSHLSHQGFATFKGMLR